MIIVVGHTSRPEGEAALARAVEEARLRAAHLSIVRTIGRGADENPAHVRAWAGELHRVREEGDELAAGLRSEGVDATFEVEAIGSKPAEHLLRRARSLGADLIVIGIRRRSPVGKLVLGSVSQDILLGADCPVLVVKATTDETRH
jgi:nucleotide-binding universal stress UspA family protein